MIIDTFNNKLYAIGGKYPDSMGVFILDSFMTDAAYQEHIPPIFYLSENYPNPFNSTTIIRFSINGSGFVSLKVYDVLGKEVAILVGNNLSVGEHEVVWSAEAQPSGVYFYQLTAGTFTDVKKLMLLK